jgi:hypothetical protein
MSGTNLSIHSQLHAEGEINKDELIPAFNREQFWKDWIIDLRTAGATQGRRALRTLNIEDVSAYCCLGRAADICTTKYQLGSWTQDAREFRFAYKDISKFGLLSQELCQVLGLSEYFMHQLTRMNDTYNLNFDDIGYEVWAYAREHKLISENWILP